MTFKEKTTQIITSEDIDRLGKKAYETLLAAVDLIENTKAKDLPETLARIKEMAYKEYPSLLPKNPRDV